MKYDNEIVYEKEVENFFLFIIILDWANYLI